VGHSLITRADEEGKGHESELVQWSAGIDGPPAARFEPPDEQLVGTRAAPGGRSPRNRVARKAGDRATDLREPPESVTTASNSP
jgi:hypothetical protein